MKKRKPITAGELMVQLQSDPEFVARREAREREWSERSGRLQAEEEPILADLRGAGWDVGSVWDLVNFSGDYREAIPVLVKHLLLPYSDRTREGIARALAVPHARYAWPTLVAEYRKAPMGMGIIAPGDTKEFRLGAKDALACALSATATEATMGELIRLAKDKAHGSSRLLLLRALRRSKSAAAKQALTELASDPDLSKEIASWKRR